MQYRTLTKQLINQGFERIERDDRLLDILSNQTREKGIELWETNAADQMIILRFSLPYNSKKTAAFSIPRSHLTSSLLNNTPLTLDHYQLSGLPLFLSKTIKKP